MSLAVQSVSGTSIVNTFNGLCYQCNQFKVIHLTTHLELSDLN